MSIFRLHLYLVLAALFLICGAGGVRAEETSSADLGRRVELAEKMVAIRPVRGQIERAVDAYIKHYMQGRSESQRELFRLAMLRAINADALEKITVDAYAETFTEKELVAMVEYYASPEARSAAAKEGELKKKIEPELIKMLDQAMMKARTEP